MIEVAVAREIAAPTLPHSRHFEAPRWWPEWIAQVAVGTASPRATITATPALAAAPAASARAAASPETAYALAAATLRAALRDAREAIAGADDWAVTTAQHQVYLARRAVRTLLETATGPGPGSRLEWCLCGEDAAAG
jgi:hypothetical protein